MHDSDIFVKGLDPTFLFAIKYDRTSNGYPHKHDYIELLYIYDGVGKYQIDEEIFEVSRGTLLIINPGTIHANIVTDTEHPLVIFALGFCDVHIKGYPDNEFAFKGYSPILEVPSQLQKLISNCFFHMLSEKEQNFPGKYDMMKCYLNQILLHIIRTYMEPDKQADSSLRFQFTSHKRKYIVKTILDYMEENFQEKISLEAIASNMYLSSIYISKLFKEETGQSPIQHLIQIRITKSIELMKTHPDWTIKKIATECGYEDVYHFSKIFKKHTGVSPKEFKNRPFRLT